MIEERGRVLERALAAHGVETHLVGFTVGPDRDPFRARARRGREGGPRDEPRQGHRLRHGLARRAHLGADSRPLGDRRRGAEPGPPARHPRRRARSRTRHCARHTRSRSPSGGTSPGARSWSTSPRCRTFSSRGRPGPASPRASTRSSPRSSCAPRPTRSGSSSSTQSGSSSATTTAFPTCSPRWSSTRKGRPTRSRWAVTEMERRYDLLAECGMRDITGYNAAVDRGELDLAARRDGAARYAGSGVTRATLAPVCRRPGAEAGCDPSATRRAHADSEAGAGDPDDGRCAGRRRRARRA